MSKEAKCPNTPPCPHPHEDHGIDNPGGVRLAMVCCHDCPCGWTSKPGDVISEGPTSRSTRTMNTGRQDDLSPQRAAQIFDILTEAEDSDSDEPAPAESP